MLPSGPAARNVTVDLVVPTMIGNSPSIVPLVSHLPILLRLLSMNQRKPPCETMSPGPALAVVVGNSVIAPPVVMRPIFDADASTNQRLLSGPTVICDGCEPAVGILYVTIVPVVEPPAPMPPVPGMPPTPAPTRRRCPPCRRCRRLRPRPHRRSRHVPAVPPVALPPVPPPDMPPVPEVPPLPAPA